MKKRNRKASETPDIEALCARHLNEEPHARHVAALVLQLFDALHGPLGLHRRDRVLLETAARLHDIGYASRPDDHVAAGIALIREHGLRGWTADRINDLTAIIALHGRLPAAPRLAERSRPDRVLRLGALLRIADALDHSHLQDTRILRVDLRDGMIRVRISLPAGSLSAERAMTKSDLWQQVFPIGIVFEPMRRKPRAACSERDTAWTAIRRLLQLQYNIMRTAARRAARDDDEEALHDLRIAVRALRRLLEAFARPLRKTSAAKALKHLRGFAKELGPARDLDVWISLLERPRFLAAIADEPHFLNGQRHLRDEAHAALRQALGAPETAHLFSLLGTLLRIELPGMADDTKPIGPLARKAVRAAWREIRANRKLAASRKSSNLHALRILLRKLRLLAHLVQPLLGADAPYLIETVHGLERNLGRIHDLDEALSRAGQTGTPGDLARALARRRRKECRLFRRAWKAFLDPAVQRRCRRAAKSTSARA
ncbi:MAG TPA: CHAD domain-containing protein [Kiritimatiellia bacterium]|nr:CHAD domain-containing protein [Kiritimatiellia bacterium]